MAIDFERELVKIADTVQPPGVTVSPAAIEIATLALYEVDRRYGPESDDPLPYHNARHSLSGVRKGVRLTNLLYPYIPPRWQPKIYELAFTSPAGHDIERGPDDLENVRLSGEHIVDLIEEKGGRELNTKIFKKRTFDVIQTTAAVRTEDGEIVQVNIQKGSHDPAKFIGAFGDKNGIAMEGPKEMIRNAVALSAEFDHQLTLNGLVDFLGYQRQFLRQGLNDWRVKGDIGYYFPESTDEVYKVMRRAFHGNIRSAHGLAVLLREQEPVRESVGLVADAVGIVDSTLLGNLLGKALVRHVAKK